MSPEDYQVLKDVANMPEDLYQMYKKTDLLRAAIVDDCRAIVFGKEKPVNEKNDISDLKNDPSVRRLAEMPDDVYQLFQIADPVRAALIAECKELVGE